MTEVVQAREAKGIRLVAPSTRRICARWLTHRDETECNAAFASSSLRATWLETHAHSQEGTILLTYVTAFVALCTRTRPLPPEGPCTVCEMRLCLSIPHPLVSL